MHHHLPLLGIKGNLRTRKVEQDEIVQNVVEVVAEKVTYLSSKLKKEADE